MERVLAPHPLCGGRRDGSGLSQTPPADPAMAGRMVEAVMVRAGEHDALISQDAGKSESGGRPRPTLPPDGPRR
ncbi:MAG: hypothetical protein CFE28_15765 [Alphaproteobacteria bacterium PA2]|nr:MAG: hypothetical protein CFE28_15765 [Alphaproteobacteria bacterium PA2]